MSFKRVKKVITTEAEIFNISDSRIYKLALECLGYNKSLADEFMLSDLGGYDKEELDQLHKMKSNTIKRARNQASAF